MKKRRARKIKIRLINDLTGWTRVAEITEQPDGYAGIAVPFVDYEHGGFGQYILRPSGERDAQGRPIFRTRPQ